VRICTSLIYLQLKCHCYHNNQFVWHLLIVTFLLSGYFDDNFQRSVSYRESQCAGSVVIIVAKSEINLIPRFSVTLTTLTHRANLSAIWTAGCDDHWSLINSNGLQIHSLLMFKLCNSVWDSRPIKSAIKSDGFPMGNRPVGSSF